MYQRKLTEKLSFATSAQVIVPIQEKLSIPSLKIHPGFDYTINPSWKFNSFLIAERQAYRPADIDILGKDRDASVSLTNFGVGFGVSWFK